MKHKLAIVSGFVVGFAGFLLLFKVIFLNRIAPSDELAPGVVMLAASISGTLFAWIGSVIYHYFARKSNYKV